MDDSTYGALGDGSSSDGSQNHDGAHPQRPHPLQGVRVLVVEDEAESREVMTLLLEDCGAVVTAMDRGERALRFLRWNTFDVIVSDIGMPGMDGYQFMRSVRDLEGPMAKIPAIAVTAFARATDRAIALRSGFQVHMTKPYDAEALCHAIAVQVGRASDS